ncbi:MAG TPA: flavodoxin family protein [Syntrophorhabdaceae bacterium]|nr:flavodoxin family protein [Syntrophorhabdaceae bacterium]
MKLTGEIAGGIATGPKRILGLVASPRKSGNCELFIKEMSRHVGEEHTLKLIRLTTLNIEPCMACYGCIMDEPCPNKDDMKFLLDEIVHADAVMIAAPVYYLGSNGIIKNILDRGFLFYTVLRETYAKPCILVNFYGIKDRIGMAPQMLRAFATFLGLDIKASVNIRAALPGEAVMIQSNIKRAKKLGGSLFLPTKRSISKEGCPFCGCEIVRLGKNAVICTLCHGRFKIDRKGSFVKLKDGGMLGPPDHMLLHKAWLRSMKAKFLAKRKQTIQTILRYKDVGEWVSPRKPE